MRRSIVAAVLVVAGVCVAPSAEAARPINACIAKTRTGPCKGPGLNTDSPNPGTNPQIQTKKVHPGKSGVFFIKLHNPNAASKQIEIAGEDGNGTFTVTYFRGSHNITSSVTSCGFMTIGAHKTVLIVMHVHVNSYVTPPPYWTAYFKVTGGGCIADSDTVWAKVKDPNA